MFENKIRYFYDVLPNFCRHVGDLGNIRENERGEVKTKIIDRKVSLIGIDSVIGKSMVVSNVIGIGVRANVHLGGQTEFCTNGEHNCLSRGPAREKNSNTELLQCLFVDGRRVVPDERLLCYPTRNVSQVDGYLFRSMTQLVKQH